MTFLPEVSALLNYYTGFVQLHPEFFNNDLLEPYGHEVAEVEKDKLVTGEEWMDFTKTNLYQSLLGHFRVLVLALINCSSIWGQMTISDTDQRKRYSR